mgnify:FL=1
MLRWLTAILLLGLSLWGALAAEQRSEPRGIRVRTWDNPRWEGEPIDDRVSRHLDFSADFASNPKTLPEMSALEMDGWVYAPRSGQYDFAVESGSAVWVRLDGRTILTHRRDRASTKATVTLDKGVHAFRVDVQHRRGASYLRVLWRMPSGYNKLVALPPIFVRPNNAVDPRAETGKPPAQAAVPTSHRLGPPILLLLAIVVAAGPGLRRRLLRLRDPASQNRLLMGVLVFGAALGVRLTDLNGAGRPPTSGRTRVRAASTSRT